MSYVRRKKILFFKIFHLKNEHGSNFRPRPDKSVYVFSETPSTPKNNDDDDGIKTNSTLDYKRQSQEINMPPTVEDIHDTEEEKQQEQDESVNDLSSPEVAQQQKQSSNPSENTEERQKSSSSRPKTAASTRSRTEYEDDNNDNEEPKASRASSSASSDNTSDLLRSDNDDSPNISDNELYNEEEEEAPIETPMKSDRITSNLSNAMNIIDQENISPLGIDKFQQQNAKGEYDASQVIQLKESFQPIINEAASYGHLDIVRKLIEVVLFKFIFLYFLFHSIVWTKCSYTKSITTDTIT